MSSPVILSPLRLSAVRAAIVKVEGALTECDALEATILKAATDLAARKAELTAQRDALWAILGTQPTN